MLLCGWSHGVRIKPAGTAGTVLALYLVRLSRWSHLQHLELPDLPSSSGSFNHTGVTSFMFELVMSSKTSGQSNLT